MSRLLHGCPIEPSRCVQPTYRGDRGEGDEMRHAQSKESKVPLLSRLSHVSEASQPTISSICFFSLYLSCSTARRYLNCSIRSNMAAITDLKVSQFACGDQFRSIPFVKVYRMSPSWSSIASRTVLILERKHSRRRRLRLLSISVVSSIRVPGSHCRPPSDLSRSAAPSPSDSYFDHSHLSRSSTWSGSVQYRGK